MGVWWDMASGFYYTVFRVKHTAQPPQYLEVVSEHTSRKAAHNAAKTCLGEGVKTFGDNTYYSKEATAWVFVESI